MKNKNPLYVVKGQNVEQAKNLFDMLIKKLDLEPVMRILNQLLEFLLSQVKSYPMFAVVKSLIDQWMLQLVPLLQQVSGMFAKA
jgi:hypothetical protein